MRRNFSSRARELSGGDVIMVSIPKSGRTWIRTFLCAYFCKRCGYDFTLEPERYENPALPRVVYSHDLFEHKTKGTLWDRLRGKYLIPAKEIRRARIILLARDPRDTFVSLYLQMTRRDSGMREKFKQKTVSDLLRDERLGIHAIVGTMNDWMDEFSHRPDFTLVRYESLRASPAEQFCNLLATVGEKKLDMSIFQTALDFSEFDNMKKLEAAAAEADKRYGTAATKISAARAKSAEKLDKAVNTELAPLKLERATFTTQIESDKESPGPQGFDRIEFWVQTNPGTRPGPLMKVASGGELSRFLLALKVVLSDRGSAPTLVFDEIDTGVGGAVADAIGARLSRLASKVQVMAVTHAPQVAARANQHLLISKDALDKGKRVATRVNALAADHRREEIARMLAGAEITAEARAAAERLLRAATA